MAGVHGLRIQSKRIYYNTPLGWQELPLGTNMRTQGGYIQIQLPGETEWENLITLESLRGPQGLQGIPGQDGKDGTGVTILGSFETAAELRAAHPPGNPDSQPGDSFLVAGALSVWSATLEDWENVGNIQGPPGPRGYSTMLRTHDNVIQWKWEDEPETAWRNLPLDFIDPRVAGLVTDVAALQTAIAGHVTAIGTLTTALNTLGNDFDAHLETDVYVATGP